MKKFVVILISIIFFIFLTWTLSASIETEYYIYENKVLVRQYFDLASNLELMAPKDISNLEINSEYKLDEFPNYYLIKINSAENLSIKYITQSMIERSNGRFYFVSRNYFDKAHKVKLVLPESAILSELGLLFPEPDEITSDGRSIILNWENYNEKQIIVDYEFAKQKNSIFYILIFIIILSFIGYFIFQRKIFKNKLEKVKVKKFKIKKEKLEIEAIEEFLMESEKAIINGLKKADKNQLWQKQLQTITGFSKAKLSRVIRNLESRSLIQKIPFGNTNKIKLKVK